MSTQARSNTFLKNTNIGSSVASLPIVDLMRLRICASVQIGSSDSSSTNHNNGLGFFPILLLYLSALREYLLVHSTILDDVECQNQMLRVLWTIGPIVGLVDL